MSKPLDFPDLFTGLAQPAEGPEPSRDNADPHPVVLIVRPREQARSLDGTWEQYEAEYELGYEHPSTCSGWMEECPLQDIEEVLGSIYEQLLPGFGAPEPDHLSDEDLAVLDGTVRFVVVTRHYSQWSTPDGTEWDVEYDDTWTDDPPLTKNGRLL